MSTKEKFVRLTKHEARDAKKSSGDQKVSVKAVGGKSTYRRFTGITAKVAAWAAGRDATALEKNVVRRCVLQSLDSLDAMN